MSSPPQKHKFTANLLWLAPKHDNPGASTVSYDDDFPQAQYDRDYRLTKIVPGYYRYLGAVAEQIERATGCKNLWPFWYPSVLLIPGALSSVRSFLLAGLAGDLLSSPLHTVGFRFVLCCRVWLRPCLPIRFPPQRCSVCCWVPLSCICELMELFVPVLMVIVVDTALTLMLEVLAGLCLCGERPGPLQSQSFPLVGLHGDKSTRRSHILGFSASHLPCSATSGRREPGPSVPRLGCSAGLVSAKRSASR